MSNREVRCQAIILDKSKRNVLLIKHQNPSGNQYWWFPGGGLELNETEKSCIERELIEELSIYAEIHNSFTLENILDRGYKKFVTFVCSYHGNVDQIQLGKNDNCKLLDAKWFSLDDDNNWSGIFSDPDIYVFMASLKEALLI